MSIHAAEYGGNQRNLVDLTNGLLPDEHLDAYRLLHATDVGVDLASFMQDTPHGESVISPAEMAMDKASRSTLRAVHMADSVVQAVCTLADSSISTPSSRDFYFHLDDPVHDAANRALQSEFGLSPDKDPVSGLVFDLESAVVVSQVMRYASSKRSNLSDRYADLEGKVYGVAYHVYNK